MSRRNTLLAPLPSPTPVRTAVTREGKGAAGCGGHKQEHTLEWLIKGLGPRGGSPSRALSGDRPVVEAEEAMDGLSPVWSGPQLPQKRALGL